MADRRARCSSARGGSTDLDGAPRVAIGTPAEFFQHVEREIHRGAPVPVWRGELYFETHRGTLTSQIRTKLGNRRCERLLREAELWAATSGVAADLDELWQDVLTQQFHDILPGSSIAWVHADAEAIHARVEQQLRERIAVSLAALAPGTPTLANVASHDRDEVVIVDDHVDELIEAMSAGTTPRSRSPQVGSRSERGSPATGWRQPSPLAVDDRVVVTDRSMTNHHLAVRWDDAGNLTSIIDVGHAREIVPDRAVAAVLELAADHPVEYDAWDLEAWTPVERHGDHDGRPAHGRRQPARSSAPSRSIGRSATRRHR